MRREAAFWDTSALVPLCVLEVSSRFARHQMRQFSTVAWWGTSVEVYSAICRLRRTKGISEGESRGATSRLALLRQAWREIPPSDDLRESAERLLEKHALRAGDSLQLAAALVWCRGRTAKRIFLCADERLSKAARMEGFTLVEWPKSP